MNIRDISERAAKTFCQTFFGVFTVNQVTNADVAGLKIALASAFAAALSIIWNAILAWSAS